MRLVAPARAGNRQSRRRERGSALVEFVVGVSLLVSLLLVVAQAAVYVYVENVAIAAAFEGARLGATLGEGEETARRKTREVLDGVLGGYAGSLLVGATGASGVIETSVEGGIEPFVPLLPRLPIRARARVLNEDEVLR